MFTRTDLGLPRTQSVLSISPISDVTGIRSLSRPRMLLTRSYSVPDMSASIRYSDTYKPTWSSYFYPYAYSSYMHQYPVQYCKPLYSISDPDRYYHYFSPYYHLPYRRYYLYSDYVNHHWHYPFTYYDRFKNFWQNYDSYYPRSN